MAAPGPVAGTRPIPKAGFWDLLERAFHYRTRTLEQLQDLHRRFGPIVMQTAPRGWTSVNLFGPDACKFVLLDRDGNLSARRSWDLIMGRIFANGLLLRDGADHRQHRRIMGEAFTLPALRGYVEHMNPRIAQTLRAWPREGEDFLAFPALKTMTLDLAASVFLGVELGPEVTRINQAFEDTVAASMSILRLPVPGLEFHRGLRGREIMVRYLRRILPEKKRYKDPDMLSQLCRARDESGHRFADHEVVDHMVFLLMAAHDTTTSTLTSMLYELARHPDWQERLREEHAGVAGERLAFDDADRMEATSWVMKETLRRYPPLSTIPRTALRDFEYDGYLVPEGTMVVVFPIHTHHMEDWWPDPFRFDPERFAPARQEDRRHSHQWIPFGGGAHTCLGLRFAELQVKTILHQILRRWRWSVPEGYEMPVQQAPISKPVDGLPLILRPL